MHTYWRLVKTISMTSTRRKMQNAMAEADEMTKYRSIAGTLLYLGSSGLPQASMAVSLTQQRPEIVTVAILKDANCMIEELKRLEPVIGLKYVSNPYSVSLSSF